MPFEMMRRLRLHHFTCLLLLLAGCAVSQKPAVCRLNLALQLFPPWCLQPEDISPTLWHKLLLSDANKDCTGAPFMADADLGVTTETLELPQVQVQVAPQALGGSSGPGTWLVWLKTHRRPDGTAIGPVAQVRADYESLEVLTVGTLRAPAENTVLSAVSTPGLDLLQVDSGQCDTDADAPGTCRQKTQLFVAVGGHFLTSERGTLDVRRTEWVQQAQGKSRLYVLKTVLAPLTQQQAGFCVKEQVIITDLDKGQDMRLGRVWRRSEVSRTLIWDTSQWQTSGPALWDRLRGAP
jgi:hypothetical protein